MRNQAHKAAVDAPVPVRVVPGEAASLGLAGARVYPVAPRVVGVAVAEPRPAQ